MLVRKVRASLELYGHFVSGVIDTKEKFQAHRYTLAKRVWTRMKQTDSLECRNCHHAEAMSSELQSARAQARHAKGKADGMTCIDCHFGIAHHEPEGGPGPQELKVGNRQ
jgi:cytochrome c-type protein NapC